MDMWIAISFGQNCVYGSVMIANCSTDYTKTSGTPILFAVNFMTIFSSAKR